jgi:hypothetical protein
MFDSVVAIMFTAKAVESLTGKLIARNGAESKEVGFAITEPDAVDFAFNLYFAPAALE